MKLTIPLDTPPAPRPRFTRAGIAYDPPESRKYKANLAQLILSQINSPALFTGAVHVRIVVYRNFKKATVPKFGDIDNLAKIILDAITMSGAVWKDDRQITDLHITKATAPEPRVEIWIEEII